MKARRITTFREIGGGFRRALKDCGRRRETTADLVASDEHLDAVALLLAVIVADTTNEHVVTCNPERTRQMQLQRTCPGHVGRTM